jgi:hypothetical protein
MQKQICCIEVSLFTRTRGNECIQGRRCYLRSRSEPCSTSQCPCPCIVVTITPKIHSFATQQWGRHSSNFLSHFQPAAQLHHRSRAPSSAVQRRTHFFFKIYSLLRHF